MRFNHDTSNNIPSDQIYNNLHNIPTAGYEAFGPIPQSQSQSQSIVNNMIYYQGLVKPQPTSSGSKRTLMPNLIGQTPPPSPGGRSFAAALRNLAKQAGPPSNHSNDKEGMESQDRHQQESLKNRITLPVFNNSQPDNESKSTGLSTEPRSGFQPYKPEEQRTVVPTSASASSHFAVDPTTYSLYHPANLYSPHFQHAFRIEEQMYLERCGVPLFPPSPYHPHTSPHPSALYGLHHLQSPLVMAPNIVDRMKIEEDQRLQRDRDMQERERRDKAKQQQRMKNVQTSAADLSARKASLVSIASLTNKPQFVSSFEDIKLPNSSEVTKIKLPI